MPPIGETTPASETEHASVEPVTPPADAAPTRDFVGWTMQAEFKSGQTLTADAGTPLVVAEPDAPAALQLRKIAEELAGRSRSLAGRQLGLTPV